MITTEGIPEWNDLKKPGVEKFTLGSLGSTKLWGTHRNVIASVNQLSKVGDKSKLLELHPWERVHRPSPRYC